MDAPRRCQVTGADERRHRVAGHDTGAREERTWGVPAVTERDTRAERFLFLSLVALFFLSGISGLVYQSLWQRLLALVFGVTVYATATVLASFMAGLALGSLLAGRLADRSRAPLALFGLTELLIALTAVSTPWALGLVTTLYESAYGRVSDLPAVLTAARFACSFLILIVPTMLMGATLPLVIASSLGRGALVGPRAGALYAANTAGAIVGALVTGFVLIGDIGIRATFIVAAAINVTVGLSALWWSRRLPLEATADRTPAAASLSDADADAATRPTANVDSCSPRSPCPVSCRSLWRWSGSGSSCCSCRQPPTPSPRCSRSCSPASLSAACSRRACSAATVTGSRPSPVCRSARGWRVSLRSRWHSVRINVDGYAPTTMSPALIAVLPPTILMGMAFPIGIRLWLGARRTRERDAGSLVGRLYAANLAGAITGPLAAGFILLPSVGSRATVVLLASLYVGAGIVLLTVHRHMRPVRLAVSVVAVLALGAGALRALPDPFRAVEGRRVPAGEFFLWGEEGAQTTVAVYSAPMGSHVLYLDGLHQANDTAGMVYLHRAIGALPMALHPNPRRALVIGLGGGVTAGAVTQFPDASVDVVELSRSVVKGAVWFKHVNYDVLTRPNLRLRVDDGRNYLLLTDRRYDVVTADIIQPVHAGAGNLYSREYFQTARRVLADDGLMLQWVGDWPETRYKLVVRTFLSVFPDTTLWANGSLLVGRTTPLKLSRAAVARALANPSSGRALADIGIHSVDDLLGRFNARPDTLRKYAGDGTMLTDDRPLIEYFLSLGGGERIADRGGLRDSPEGLLVD